MSALAEARNYTPDDLLALPEAAGVELVDGKLVEKSMGALSSWVSGRLYYLLAAHDPECIHGWPFPSDTGIRCFAEAPDRVRKPDVCYLQRRKLPNGPPEGWIEVVPDLAVEVMSRNDIGIDIDEKVGEYQRAGIRLVWVINPRTRSVTRYHPGGEAYRLTEEHLLSGEDVVPGFQCMVSDLFPPLSSTQGDAV